MLIKITRGFRSLNSLGKYCLQYKVGEVTESLPGTVGIFCYNSLENVKEMIRNNQLMVSESSLCIELLEVGGIGEPKRGVAYTRVMAEDYIDTFYKDPLTMDFENICFTSDGVICYPAVKVIRLVNLGFNCTLV